MQTWMLEQMNNSEGNLFLFIIDAYSCIYMDNLGNQSSDKLQGHIPKETVKVCAITLNIPEILFQCLHSIPSKPHKLKKKNNGPNTHCPI